MPVVSLEYRYPAINVQPWAPPRSSRSRRLSSPTTKPMPASSPTRRTNSVRRSNLFSSTSSPAMTASGWRRAMSACRHHQFDRGGSVMCVGQSYQMFGLNSYAVADATNTGLDSGLQIRVPTTSPVWSPNRTYTFSVRSRIDGATLNINRFEAEGAQLRPLVRHAVRQVRPSRNSDYLTRRRPARRAWSNWRRTGWCRDRPAGILSQQDQSASSGQAMWTIASCSPQTM